MKERKLYIIIPACIVFFLALVYVVGMGYFTFHMMPKSYLANYAGSFDISFLSEEDLSQVLAKNDESTFSVYREEQTYTFPLSDVKSDDTEEVSADYLIHTQQVALWPAAFFEEKQFSMNTGFLADRAKLANELQELKVCEGIPSEDAYIAVNDEGEFRIVDEVYGTEVEPSLLEQKICDVLPEGALEVSVTEDMYIPPVVTSGTKSLAKQFDKIQKMVGRTLTIDMYDAQEEISAGYFYDNDRILQDGKFVVLEDKVDAYMDDLYKKYDTYNKKRKFVNHAGKKIKVGAAGDSVADSYGFSMNVEETRNNLMSAIENPDISDTAAVWYQVGNLRDKKNKDIGHTYIEVSIDEQHLWYFRDGELILDDAVVTGMPTPAKHTPKGIFTIFWKDTNTRLRGNQGGERWDVRVSYWMSVTYTGVGIHTANWQPSFGGDAYTYRGSHGCINVSESTARSLYEKVEIGTPVVIY